MPISSTAAAPSARTTVVEEFEELSVEVVLVVVWVGVVAAAPPVSSLNGALGPRPADAAAAVPGPASVSARAAHTHRHETRQCCERARGGE